MGGAVADDLVVNRRRLSSASLISADWGLRLRLLATARALVVCPPLASLILDGVLLECDIKRTVPSAGLNACHLKRRFHGSKHFTMRCRIFARLTPKAAFKRDREAQTIPFRTVWEPQYCAARRQNNAFSSLRRREQNILAQSKVTRHELLAIKVDEHQRAVTFGASDGADLGHKRRL
jgi:hypothetical protein